MRSRPSPFRWFLLAGLCLALLVGAGGASADELRLEDIFSAEGLTGPTPTQLRWRPDGKLLSFILQRTGSEERDLWAVDPASGEKRILVSQDQLQQLAPPVDEATSDERERERLRRYSVAAYLWSPDSKSILFTRGGRLYLYDVAAGRARPIAPEKQGVRDPKFSPNGRWISFAYEHDIWLAPVSGAEERQLTFGGSETLLHGDLDWVYPEEFAVRTAYHWSPNSRRIAFLEFDESVVPTYPISDLSKVRAAVEFQRYPKAGDPNPRVRVGVIEAKPSEGDSLPVIWLNRRAEYTPRLAWVNDEWLAVQFLNRAQNELELVFADASNGRMRTVLVERDPYWINLSDDLTFLDDSRQFLWTSERTGLRHIFRYGYDGEMRRALTGGEWEVKAIEGLDPEGGWIYYTSNEHNALGRDLYRVKLDGSGKQRLTPADGTHQITLDKTATAYADQHSSLARVPRLAVHHMPSGRTSEVHAARSLESYDLAEPELLEWRTPDGALVRGLLLKPRPLEAGRRYPVVIYVYGGPRAPTIRDAWDSRGRYLFHQYLAQQGYVAFQIDDRSSAVLGHRYEANIHRNYGPAGLRDYEFAAGKIRAMDFADPDRLALWGWSGGGFSTCFALTHSKLFRLGIAVAPVTDWRLYDSIYTERYMGLPSKEAEAYEKTSALAAAKNLHGRLLLVHGTADDNVHVQNTMQMIEALVEAGKPYDLLIYPGKTHSIHGSRARLHLFRAIEEYLRKHL